MADLLAGLAPGDALILPDGSRVARLRDGSLVVHGFTPDGEAGAVKSARVTGLNGQETWRGARQDDEGGYAAGGGAANLRPRCADGAQHVPGGVPGSTAGGEPPRGDWSEPRPRVAAVPGDGDDAACPPARGVPPRPGRDWPAPYMDGWWPAGGHGTQQAPAGSVGGGERGRPPGAAGKAAGIGGVPVSADTVYQAMRANFPPEALSWVKDARWVLASVPQDRVDRDDQDAWAASHQQDRVEHFARLYREDPGSVNPAVAVLEPGEDRVKIIDGHHRDEGAAMAGVPLRAYVGHVATRDGPWNETHSSQFHSGTDPENR